ncbi:glycosyltransferase [Tunturiibacter gelidoferens]|uniref:4,4'-diaponeurosporenoate glycosyltransferase n=1 Tax=Tunturiibacter gelidiferens TaxID=3069689 RepID=A0ACC5P1L6_9BACT|nr:glycosyltransferase [Edaphobacter lichenicola]MBB5340737.1 4,4'-diaponeurosporenoate glycosyltransferase [Edaphobacter lichenicola]
MIIPALLGVVGLPAGFLLIRRVPTCPSSQSHDATSLSIVIPARNEEDNLPRLLRSIAASVAQPAEILVVDDASTDKTAPIARSLGATVITSAPLPDGWTGKAWACHQGAQRAIGNHLLFLDADTFFVDGGLDRLVVRWLRERDPRLVLSLLPYHAMSATYEQLSLFFNVLMAGGAGGFGLVSEPRLFGQSLLISKETYFAVGGHAAVRGFVLENLNLADLIGASGTRILCLGGRGTLHMRMFPEGLGQMSDSWTKAFIHGAAVSDSLVLASAVMWISALWSTAILLIVPRDYGRLGVAVVYLLLSLQLVWLARQLGSYRFLTCLLYPLPLAYYCAVFGRSAARRALRRKTVWRGREV